MPPVGHSSTISIITIHADHTSNVLIMLGGVTADDVDNTQYFPRVHTGTESSVLFGVDTADIGGTLGCLRGSILPIVAPLQWCAEQYR